MFSGVFQHSIDAKGRTSLPSKFREILSAQGAEKLFITQDLIDDCLVAFAPAAWTKFAEKVAARSMFDPDVRKVARMFIAPAHECPVDKLGRILIPPSLRESAGLVEEITWAGQVERIEIWAPLKWAAVQKKARESESGEQLARRLSEFF
jgi:transcriptional regulator MraZ